jgi:hypothetical protein
VRGDIDNTQPVCLDGASSAKARVIYSLRRVPEQKLQFGTVQVDYGTVAVWRPFDPDDTGYEAAWRSIPWRNVYRIHVPRHPIPDRPKYVEYAIEEMALGDVRAKLPVAMLELSYHLKEHLKTL